MPPAGDLMVIDDPLVALGAKGQQLTASPGHSSHQEKMNKCVAAKAAGGKKKFLSPISTTEENFCLFFVCLFD